MQRYLVESEHQEKECVLVVGEVHSMGFLHHFDWGCEAGVHCGWAVIDADSEEDAMLTVPLIVRPRARAVRLTKFSEEDFKRSHHAG